MSSLVLLLFAKLLTIEDTKYLGEVFPVEQMVYLEETEQSLLGMISTVDRSHDKVYRFARDGSFAGILGQTGQGPGEYRSALALKRVFGDHIGVLDHVSGRVFVYTSDGTPILTTPTQLRIQSPMINSAFVWENPSVLYNAGLPPGTGDDFVHIIHMDEATQLDAGFAVTGNYRIEGFGETLEHLYHLTGGPLPLEHMKQINGQLWLGDAYSSQTHIYDLNGRLLKTLENRCAYPMDHKGFIEFKNHGDKKAFFIFRNQHCFNNGIFQANDDLVIVSQGARGVLFYNGQGDPIGGQKLNDLGFIRDADNGMLITVYHESMARKPHYSVETGLLATTAWHPDGNPALRIGRLRPR